MVRNATGNVSAYWNGVAIGSPQSAPGSLNAVTANPGIGYRTVYNDLYFNGYISNLRIVNGVAVYTGTFTVPTAPLATTQSSGANISAITGTQTSLLLQPVAGWTAECWVNPSGDYSSYRTIFAKRVTASATTEYEVYLRTSTGVISFYNGTNYESTTTLTANTWSHCAWVYTGANIVIYVNGTQVYTSAVTITTNTEPLVIGGARGQAEYFLGYLSNFRFTRGIVYTGTFTRPTRPLAATQTVSGNIAAITGNATSRTNLLVLQSSTYKDNSVSNYLYGYTYTINTGAPIIKLDTSPFVDPALGLFAYGGGAGGFNDTTNNANTGGSGGGNWYPSQAGAVSIQPTTSYYNGVAYPSTGFGNAGGLSGAVQIYGAGGGGAGGAGSGTTAVYAGAGGIGRQYSISGVATYYAGGGSSAATPLQPAYLVNAGGLGGGGTGDNSYWATQQVTGYAGSTGTVNATANGAPYTGGGGGSGGTGGSGIVILRYLGAPIATGGTITSWGAYTIHTFTQSDTFTMSANISVGSSGGNGGPYAGGGGGAAGYLGFGGNGAAGSSLAAGNYGTGGGGGGGSSGNVFGGGGGGVDIWGLGVSGGYGGAAPATSYSILLNGTSQFLSIAQDAAFSFGTGDFTVEGWFYFNSIGYDNCLIMLGTGAIGGGPYAGWWLRYIPTAYGPPSLGFYRYDGAETTNNFALGSALSTNTWYHIACSRNGTNLRMFLNGTQVGTTITSSLSFSNVNSDPVQVGKVVTGGGTFYLSAYINNIRIVKGTALYTANFTVPTPPLQAIANTSLLIAQSSSIIDTSTNAFTITATGSPTVSSTVTPTGTAGNPGTGSSSENILGLTGNGAQPGFGANGGLYGGGGGGGVTSLLDLSQGWGGDGAFALIYSIDSGSYQYPIISPVNLNYSSGIQTTNTTNFNSNLTASIGEEAFDQAVVNNIGYGPTAANSPVKFDYFTDNNTGRTLVTRSAMAANNVIAADITVTVNYQAEWMLVNYDPAFPATYDRAYNYQVAKPITTANDPRKLTVKPAYITKTGNQQDPTEPDQFL